MGGLYIRGSLLIIVPGVYQISTTYMVKVQKHEIRQLALNKRLDFSRADLLMSCKLVAEKLEKMEIFRDAKRILFYMPIKNEVDVVGLMRKYLKKKDVLLPRIGVDNRISMHQISSLEELVIGKFGISEASKEAKMIEPGDVDLVLVPGIAFDVKGSRIGYGQGYYDRLLKGLSCPRVALAYEFQIYNELPFEEHDEKVDFIITEEQIVDVRS